MLHTILEVNKKEEPNCDDKKLSKKENKMIGFIGLGIMGKPMAINLLKKGVPLLVNDLVQKAVDETVSHGATFASAKEIGEKCDVIFMILPNGDIVKSVLFGESGAAAKMKRGSLVVDMSSVTPAQSKFCANRLKEQGVGFLDAPVSGGEPGAINATLAFMVGGEQLDFDKAKPYFEKMGSSAVLIGESGSGSVTKLANQIIVNLGIAAVSEAFVLATKAGADPEKVYQAIRGGLAGSAVLDAKAAMIYNRNFKPGGKISINHKDIKNVMATAKDLTVPLPFSSQLFEVMQALMAHGMQDQDHSAIVRYFEEMAQVTVQKKNA
ncbi:MAG: 2-hydroxy-3-oxopropionate reductase [Eubacteriales bacterium]|nr:2-hydroxy-3-oxopropionate reductase [Eubacteriales bacterium]